MWDNDEDMDALILKQAYNISIDSILAGDKNGAHQAAKMHQIEGDHAKRYSCFM